MDRETVAISTVLVLALCYGVWLAAFIVEKKTTAPASRRGRHRLRRTRPTWDEWGIELACAVARRADCTRRQVGTVLMSPDHSIVATGYNGAPAGLPGCLSNGACPRGQSDVAPGSSYDTGAGSCIALHAEQNALLRASWSDMVGSTLYVTDEPCEGCRRMIAGTPITHVVWPTGAWDPQKGRNR